MGNKEEQKNMLLLSQPAVDDPPTETAMAPQTMPLDLWEAILETRPNV